MFIVYLMTKSNKIEKIIFCVMCHLRRDKYSKQACYTFKFHPEIKILLKIGCQQTTRITNKTRDAIKKKKKYR